MTNQELREMCQTISLNYQPKSPEKLVADFALRLLAQCEAMQKVVDATKRYLDLYDSESDECDLMNRMDEAHEDILAALSQLGERT